MLPEAEAIKQEGNGCMEKKKYIEGMLHYTKAIKIEPNNPALYSNRSLAFLRMQQHYHALDDAKTCNRLMPGWPKGYFRKGEVLYDAQQYREAYEAYQKGLSIEPTNKNLVEASAKAEVKMKIQEKAERRIPWYGIGVGMAFGLVVVCSDELLAKNPKIQNPLFQVLIVFATALIGFGMSIAYRAIQRMNRTSLLDPPVDLFPDQGNTSSPPSSQNAKPQPSKSQAEKSQEAKHKKSPNSSTENSGPSTRLRSRRPKS